MKLYLASNNPHKAAELSALARHDRLGVEIISARAVGGMPPVAEDTGTFEGNARKKAQALLAVLTGAATLPAAARQGEGWVLADDSGLGVDALDGAPGVESANYAGPGAADGENLAKLVAAMRQVPAGKRGAQFGCVLLLLGVNGEEHTFAGHCAGQLLTEPDGVAGFGYDPLFMPEGETRSMAAMSAAEKNLISHRARAWAKLSAWLKARAGLNAL